MGRPAEGHSPASDEQGEFANSIGCYRNPKSLDNLTGLLRAQGQYEEAERLRRRALAIREAASWAVAVRPQGPKPGDG